MPIAESQLKVREFPGSESNPEILKYYKATSLGGHPEDGSTPWCSAFVNWVMQEAGYRGTRRANARSWLDWGEKLTTPRVGCITVLWRGALDSTQGHVGFFVAALPNRIVLLSGNQGNQVSRLEYGSGRVLSFRWPREIDKLHG